MNLKRDISFALRSFARSPLFVTVAALSLAFGIGANTAIFSLTDQILVRSLPVKDPGQLVLLSALGRHYGSNQGWNRLSYPMYQDFRDHDLGFQGMFCFRDVEMSLGFGGRTERVAGEVVSGNYFPVLGVNAALGRLFTAKDDLYQGGHPVAVLSYDFWRNRFAGNPGILGQKLLVNGFPFTVVGVSPPEFSGTDPSYAPQVRVPVTMAAKLGRYMDLNDRRSRWVTVFGRLKPGVTLKEAKARIQPYFHSILQMEVQQKAFAKAGPELTKAFLKMSMDGLRGSRRRSPLRRRLPKSSLVLTATVGLGLRIACPTLV